MGKIVSEALEKLIETSNLMIESAKDMIHSCQRKKHKVFSNSRVVISFFLRRSYEMFESFIIHVREGRIIDSALLLRSLVEMGISLGYIFANDIDDREKEIRAIKYILDGNRRQLKLIEYNLEGFREFDSDIDRRRDEINDQIVNIEKNYYEKYGNKKWHLPDIKARVLTSNSDFIKSIYNQSYRYLSAIEHHSVLFGQHYVDYDNCEPIIEINHLEHYSQLKLSVSLFFFRSIFVEVLNVFNDEFQLNWEKQIEKFRKLQDYEYPLLQD